MRDVPLKGDAPQPGRYVKISVFLKKRPDITDDYFRTYWYHNHAILFVKSAAFQKYVVKYNQSHFYREQTDSFAEILAMPAVEYDGVAEFWVESIENWKKLWADEEFLKGVEGDADHYVAQPMFIAAGQDYLFLDRTESKDFLQQPAWA